MSLSMLEILRNIGHSIYVYTLQNELRLLDDQIIDPSIAVETEIKKKSK